MVTTHSSRKADAKTRRVLYVDDMRELREVAKLALTRCGHSVDVAPDGADAFEMIIADNIGYDIVITDHHMSGMNGLELVMKLREAKYPGMIAVVSSELNDDVEADYRRLGVDKILYKPVSLADMRKLVQES
jgi:two-component system chemotaxis response regulator CheY